jgi:hypothetical protein
VSDFKDDVKPTGWVYVEFPWADDARNSVRAADIDAAVSAILPTYPAASVEDVRRTFERAGVSIIEV